MGKITQKNRARSIRRAIRHQQLAISTNPTATEVNSVGSEAISQQADTEANYSLGHFNVSAFIHEIFPEETATKDERQASPVPGELSILIRELEICINDNTKDKEANDRHPEVRFDDLPDTQTYSQLETQTAGGPSEEPIPPRAVTDLHSHEQFLTPIDVASIPLPGEVTGPVPNFIQDVPEFMTAPLPTGITPTETAEDILSLDTTLSLELSNPGVREQPPTTYEEFTPPATSSPRARLEVKTSYTWETNSVKYQNRYSKEDCAPTFVPVRKPTRPTRPVIPGRRDPAFELSSSNIRRGYEARKGVRRLHPRNKKQQHKTTHQNSSPKKIKLWTKLRDPTKRRASHTSSRSKAAAPKRRETTRKSAGTKKVPPAKKISVVKKAPPAKKSPAAEEKAPRKGKRSVNKM